jgi:polyhydroxyalkanoate depolymerase
MDPVRHHAGGVAMLMRAAGAEAAPAMRRTIAACELMASIRTTHRRPDFGLATTRMGNREVAVREEVVRTTPFGSLLRFAKDAPGRQPPLLLVAPMSGHFATLLRDTAETLLPDFDLHVTDWHNARDAPLSAGASASTSMSSTSWSSCAPWAKARTFLRCASPRLRCSRPGR